MKHGDFTELAKFYVDRPGYSVPLLTMIKNHVVASQGLETSKMMVADIGAGTGKLTEILESIHCTGYAVEPNEAMREEGVSFFLGKTLLYGAKELPKLLICLTTVLTGF